VVYSNQTYNINRFELQCVGITLGERSVESGKKLMFFMGDSMMMSDLNLKRSHASTEGSD
jgi:hypothetical protein